MLLARKEKLMSPVLPASASKKVSSALLVDIVFCPRVANYSQCVRAVCGILLRRVAQIGDRGAMGGEL